MKRIIIIALVLSLAFVLFAEENTEKKGVNLKPVKVLLQTTKGDMVLELYPGVAPITVENFLTYVKQDFFNGLVFHRVIGNFMIQGGGFDIEAAQKTPTQPAIKNEADNGLTNDLGTIAMARTNVVDSATSQFFINTKDNSFLNHTAKTSRGYGYCVFGKVIKGLEVIKAIEAVKTGNNPKTGMADWPLEDIVITATTIME